MDETDEIDNWPLQKEHLDSLRAFAAAHGLSATDTVELVKLVTEIGEALFDRGIGLDQGD